MVSDQEIATGVEAVLRQADPNSVTSLNGVVQQLEAKLGLDLSHKAGFIRDQINFLFRSQPPRPSLKDHFAPQQQPQFYPAHPQHFHPHFALQPPPPPQQQRRPDDLNFCSPLPLPQPQQAPDQVQSPRAVKSKSSSQNATANASKSRKESAEGGTKRKRGGPGGLNKACRVSPELQAIVGEAALSRTEIVKQLWVYIKKNNLQYPNNKRKIICDDALRLVLETDSTDMFKMNKLLAKHIIPLEPTKESSRRSKKSKIKVEPTTESPESGQLPVIISAALTKFFGTGEREMDPSKALNRVWEYIKANHLEDPLNSMVIQCDARLCELLGCESITALGVQELLLRHHLYKQ